MFAKVRTLRVALLVGLTAATAVASWRQARQPPARPSDQASAPKLPPKLPMLFKLMLRSVVFVVRTDRHFMMQSFHVAPPSFAGCCALLKQ